ncbi:mechanosensitive ion channel protein MscS [Solemya pervernicosa gill symbiont]|uniref:Mechanosensitive ion channel protein MscS n=2 Tax=Gammaproteobacteria incertae sedis TaxID=118884 RepID=A0A1T2L0W3_9GAMM|nr:mechanosensitive ion channel domain-containing protein [Candidatus Reidiella endopervernicosa]OOZ38650.1 mechanosensitive ion channel protein MscS [Solemya pervernicosa gill symbiont]QKQ26018.1 mechanosensitive ion channel [Candidatus Reidiella endopervernicosa]
MDFESLITTTQHYLGLIATTQVAIQLSIIILSLLLARLLHYRWVHYLDLTIKETREHRLRRITLRGTQRLVFPFATLLLVMTGRAILEQFGGAAPLLDIVVPLMLSLAAIRLTFYSLRMVLRPGPALKAWESVVSTLVWVVVALHLLGLLPGVLDALDGIAITVGTTRVSLLSTMKLLLSIGLFLILALWLSKLIERVVSRAGNLSPGMRVGLTKFSKFFLLTLAMLIALNSVGIDLTALTVFGGALGVGLGFGLQRIASNFISGFILIFDRSIRPGDTITIGGSFGWVQELRARYVVIRDRDGVETLIPNENLITTEVINWSHSDPDVRIKLPVSIGYDDDPEQAMATMIEAALEHPRVLKDPPPVSRLISFGDSGIELQLRIWINDPQNGVGNVRSDLNLEIWRRFKTQQITIPYPQRDLHIRSGHVSASSE